MTKSGRRARMGVGVCRAIIGLFVQTPILMSDNRLCRDQDRLIGH